MTFSSVSLSACDVDEVAATAAGVTGLRGAACWRVAGASTGVATGLAEAGAGAEGLTVAVAAGAVLEPEHWRPVVLLARRRRQRASACPWRAAASSQHPCSQHPWPARRLLPCSRPWRSPWPIPSSRPWRLASRFLGGWLRGSLSVPLVACLAGSFAVSSAVSLDLARATQPIDRPAIRHMARPADRHAARERRSRRFVAPNQSIGSRPICTRSGCI